MTRTLPRRSKLSPRKALCAAIAAHVLLTAQAHASPSGGNVVGGVGSIDQVGKQTTIIQDSDRLSIDWESFDIAAGERVEFIQPSSSSLALNRVLGNDASHIFGKLDANGQVILVNPNGVVFGEGASVNVGGLVASGLDIDPSEFMNGESVFSAVDGTQGLVINSGLINAATGGSVALVGKQVENRGVIAAKLGDVTLAAGKEAVLTFDNQGLIGVRVSKAILQEEIGLDAAVNNSGTIAAEGGKILLSASVSEDIFTRAVNAGDLSSDTSVVIHDDGSFTLGAGADVINTGALDVANMEDSAGIVAVLGNNVTHLGTITADSSSAAGYVEVHSVDTTLINSEAKISARATESGQGGDIKVLGERVGILGESALDASGADGGGNVKVGGGFQGEEQGIRNAQRTVVGRDANIAANALLTGQGGEVIVWADDTTVFNGEIGSRGGEKEGDGGFVEVSGKRNLGFDGIVDRSSPHGNDGTLLLDPSVLYIRRSDLVEVNDGEVDDGSILFDEPDTASEFTISDAALTQALSLGDVLLQADQDIIADGVGGGISIALAPENASSLILEAGRYIQLSDANIALGSGTLLMTTGVDGWCDECGVTLEEEGIVLERSQLATTGDLIFHSISSVIISESTLGGEVLTPNNVYISARDQINVQLESGLSVAGNLQLRVSPSESALNASLASGAEYIAPLLRISEVSEPHPSSYTITMAGTNSDEPLNVEVGENTYISALSGTPEYGSVNLVDSIFHGANDGNKHALFIAADKDIYVPGVGTDPNLGIADGKVELDLNAGGTLVFSRGINTGGESIYTTESMSITVGTETASIHTFGGSVSLVSMNDIELPAVSTLGGDKPGGLRSESAEGSINADASIHTIGNVVLTAGIDVRLNSAIFTAGGAVSIDSGGGVISGGEALIDTGSADGITRLENAGTVDVSAQNDIFLPSINTINSRWSGSSTVFSGGGDLRVISRSGNVSASLPARIGEILEIEAPAAGSEILLTSDLNIFGRYIILHTGTATISSSSDLTFDQARISSGTFNVTGDIQTSVGGRINVPGLLSLNANGANISLSGEMGLVSVSNANRATLRADGMITLAAVSDVDSLFVSASIVLQEEAIRTSSLLSLLLADDGSAELGNVENQFGRLEFQGGYGDSSSRIEHSGSLVIGTLDFGGSQLSISAHGAGATLSQAPATTMKLAGENVSLSANKMELGAENAEIQMSLENSLSILLEGESSAIKFKGKISGSGLSEVAGFPNLRVVGSRFNDTISIEEGALFESLDQESVIYSGLGDDTIILDAHVPFRIDGAEGSDTLRLASGAIKISEYIGGDEIGTVDTLVSADEINRWSITGTGGGILFSDSGTEVPFAGVESFIGGTLGDDFTVTGRLAEETKVFGGLGSDSLSSKSQTSSMWFVNGTGSGSLDSTISFYDFERLTAGSGGDSFQLAEAAVVQTINGGSGSDRLTLSKLAVLDSFHGYDGNDMVVIADSVSVNGIIDGGAGIDSIDISAISGGLEFDYISGMTTGSVTYTGFESIQQPTEGIVFFGGDGDTRWTFTEDASFTIEKLDAEGNVQRMDIFSGYGMVRGGEGENDYLLPDSGVTADVDIRNTGGGVHALHGGDIDTSWVVEFLSTGAGVGTVQAGTGGGVVSFSGVDTLVGGSGADTFDLSQGPDNNNAQFGEILGGAGDDSLILAGGRSVGMFDGGAGSDVLSGGAGGPSATTWVIGTDVSSVTDGFGATADFVNVETIISNALEDSLSVDTVGANLWHITANASGSLNDTLFFEGMATLLGGDEGNEFIVDPGVIAPALGGGNGDDTFTLGEGASLANSRFFGLSAGGGDDTVILADGNSISQFTISGGTGNDYLEVNGTSEVIEYDFVNDAGVVGGLARIFEFENVKLPESSSFFGGDGTTRWTFAEDSSFIIEKLDAEGNIGKSGNFSGFSTIRGGNGQNDFLLTEASSYPDLLILADASSVNTLHGSHADSTWSLTGPNSGSVQVTGATSSTVFENVSTLVGGTGADSFNILSGGMIDGSLAGGAGEDTLTIANDSLANQWNLDAVSSVDSVAAFSGIEALVGSAMDDAFTLLGETEVTIIDGGVGLNRLTGPDQANTWVVGVEGTSTLNGALTFHDIGEVYGGSQGDTFLVESDASIALSGRGGDDSLQGPDQVNDWNIIGAHSGTLNDAVIFSEFETLNGGALADSFVMADFATVGRLAGGAGDDRFVLGADAQAEVVDGGLGSDTVDVGDVETVKDFLGNLTVGGSSFTAISVEETFSTAGTGLVYFGGDGNNLWQIDGNGSGTLIIQDGEFAGEYTFSNVTSLRGGEGADDFVLLDGGTLAGTLDGGANTNRLTGKDLVNEWLIDGANRGQVTGSDGETIVFRNIAELIGGDTFGDSFSLTGGGAVSSIRAGSGFDDTLIVNTTADVVWKLGESANNLAVAQSEPITFTGVETLLGGQGQDLFDIEMISGLLSLDGRQGTDELSFIRMSSPIVVNLASGQANELSFLNLERFSAFSADIATSALIAEDLDNSWTFGGGQGSISNAMRTVEFVGFNELYGGAEADSFVMTDADAADLLLIDGGGFQGNSLQAANQNNRWLLSANGGSLNGLAFTNFGTLLGGLDQDIFILDTVESVQATHIDAGAGSDWIEGPNESNTWKIYSDGTGSVTDFLTFSDVENLQGGLDSDLFDIESNSVVTTVAGGAGDDVFITGANVTASNLLGEGGDDRFEIGNGLTASGAVDGGEGMNDILDLRNHSVTAAAFDPALLGFTYAGFETVYEPSPEGTYFAGNGTNVWYITGQNSGRLEVLDGAEAGVYEFGNTHTLVGGSGSDTFIFVTPDAGISSSIEGGAGDNTLTAQDLVNSWLISAANSGQFSNIANPQGNVFANIANLIGGSEADTFTLLAGGSVSGSIDAGAGLDTLVADNGLANTWQLSGALNEIETIARFAGFETLAGGVDGDIFNLLDDEHGISRIDGRGGEDRVNALFDSALVLDLKGQTFAGLSFSGVEYFGAANGAGSILGVDADSFWNLDGLQAGHLSFANEEGTVTLRFSGFSQVQGGTGDDEFILSGEDSLNVVFDGGSGSNSLDLQGLNVDVNLGVSAATDLPAGETNLQLTNIDTVKGNAEQSTALYGDSDQSYTWIIDTARGGRVTASLADENNRTLYFEDITAIVGGGHDDFFQVLTDASALSLHGGDAVTADFVDYSAAVGDIRISFADALTGNGGIRGVEGVRGNSAGAGSLYNAELVAGSGDNLWQIGASESSTLVDGVNDGVLSDGTQSITFIDFNRLTGGAGSDTFKQSAGVVDGTLAGGAGDDHFEVNVVGINRGTLIDGGAGTDALVVTGGADAERVVYTPSASGGRFIYESADGDYVIDHTAVETSSEQSLVRSLRVNGTEAADTFYLAGDSFRINNANALQFAGKDDLWIEAGSNDFIELSGDLAVAGSLTLVSGTVSTQDSATTSVTAAELVLQNTRDVGSVNARIRTNVDSLRLRNGMGNVYLEEQNGLDLAEFATSGEFDLVLIDGALTSSSALVSSDDLRVSARAGDILLGLDNELTGRISLNSPGLVELNNRASSNIAEVSAADLILSSDRNLNAEGAIVASGDTRLEAGGNIVFTNAQNDFNRLRVEAANDVSVVDGSAIALAGIEAQGRVAVDAEDITVDDVINAEAIDLDAKAGQAVVDAALTTFGGGIQISGNGIELNAPLDSSTFVRLVSTGSITQNASINARGNIDALAENGGITVGDEASTEGDVVTISASQGLELQNIHANSISLTGGNLVVTNGSLVAEDGDIKVTVKDGDYSMSVSTVLEAYRGTITIDAANDVNAGAGINGGSVDITGGNVNIDGAVTATTGGVNVRGDSAVSVNDSVSADGGVSISTGSGSINQSGAVSSAGGNVTVNAGGTGDVVMDSDATTSAGGSVAIGAGGSVTLGSVSSKDNVSVDSGGGIADGNGTGVNVSSGSFTANAGTGVGGGDALESAVGSVNLDTKQGSIGLNNQGNLNVEKAATSSGNVQVSSSDNITLAGGSVSAGGSGGDAGDVLIVSSNGGVRQTGSLDQPAVRGSNLVIKAGGDVGEGGLKVEASPGGSVLIEAERIVGTIQSNIRAILRPASGVKIQDEVVAIEPLEDFDPAIFADVKSYFHNDISLRLPQDQLYEEEEEE